MKLATENPGPSELALILAAEKLFAEHGIAAVSLRQINQAANQKNISAAHYHFGSREGLVMAVLSYRWPQLDRRRAEMLNRPASAKDMRFYLEAFILPLVDELIPRPEGNYYIRFMQQYEREHGDYEVARRLTPAGVEIYRNIERLIYYVPEPVRRLRIGYLINMIHSVFAAVEERIGAGAMRYEDVPLTASNAIDMFAAALSAPLSAETIAALPGKQVEKRRGLKPA